MWRKQFTVGRTRTREKGGKTRTATHTSKEESESEREKETKQIISSPVRLSFPSRRRFLFFRPKRRYETFGPERHSQTTQGESTLAVVSRPRRGICRSFFSFLFSSLLLSAFHFQVLLSPLSTFLPQKSITFLSIAVHLMLTRLRQ